MSAMTIWVILAAMTGAAVMTLLWPLSRRLAPAVVGADGRSAATLASETGFYRDQLAEIGRDEARGLIAGPEAEAARSEAARRLLRASRTPAVRPGAEGEPALRRRRAASAFALSTVPLVALLAYGLYGSPDLPAEPAAARVAGGATRDITTAVGEIEAHLAKHPEDGQGWSVIAPVYLRLGRADEAVRAYANALRLSGEDAGRLADYGEAVVAAASGVVSATARAAFERAAVLDPAAPKPRFYLAEAAAQDGDKAGARQRYADLLASAPADASWRPLVRDTLARLDGKAGSEQATAPGPATNPAGAQAIAGLDPGARQAAIRSMVASLDGRLAAQGGSAAEWGRLVRAYGVLGERDRAEAAFRRAHQALAADPAGQAEVEAVARTLNLHPSVAELPR
jgi:cytochrome c-type biogenesis protein CcmH